MTVDNSTSGGSSRRIIVSAAVLVVAMFMAVPLAVAYDSDAAYGNGDAGYTLETNEKASAAELTAVGLSKEQILEFGGSAIAESVGFDVTDMTSSPTAETFTFKKSAGEKADSGTMTSVTSMELEATKLSVTFTAQFDEPMFPDAADTSPKMAEAINAIKAYFQKSTFTTGDRIIVSTDSVKFIDTDKKMITYGDKDETKCLETSSVDTDGFLLDTKAVITYKPVTGAERSITVDVSAESINEINCTDEYAKDLKDVSDGDFYNVKTKFSTKSLSYSLKYTVGDNDYKVDDIESADTEVTVPAMAFAKDKSDVSVNASLKTFCDNLKDSDNVKTQVGYDKAESAYDSAVDEVSPAKKKTPVALIVVGVVAAVVVIGAVAFFVVKKKA